MKIERTYRTKNYKDFEVSKEVKLYKVTMPCSRCDGEMEFTGESFCTYPPCNIHECNKCGYKEEFLGVEYPRMEYR